MQPAMTSPARRIFMLIALLAVVGIAVSSVALRSHYTRDKSSYCNFSETLNCDMVNRSSYSEVWGIPVALIGFLGYAFLMVLATVRRQNQETPSLLLASAAVGLVFALYLTYVEAYILGVWCILCLTSLGAIAVTTLLASVLFVQSRRSS